MIVTGRVESDITFISVSGDIDMFNSKIFEDELYRLVNKEQTGGVKIDLKGSNYMDSSGLGVLFAVIKRLRRAGIQVWVTNVNEKITSVIELAGLDKIFFKQ